MSGEAVRALEAAVRRGDVSAVKSHLDAGGSPDATVGSRQLLDVAANYGQPDIVDLLLKAGATIGDLRFPCAAKAGVLAGVPDDTGTIRGLASTALHNVCGGEGDLEKRKAIVRMLQGGRAGFAWAMPDGLTPMQRCNCPELADFLVSECGADPRSRPVFYPTPLYEAPNAAMARWWVEKQGLNVNARDEHANTPLHIAAAKARSDVMVYLIHQGADAEARDVFKSRPIHSSLGGVSSSMALTLIEAGADTTTGPLPEPYNASFPSLDAALVRRLRTTIINCVLDPTKPISLRSAFSDKTIATRALRWVLTSPAAAEMANTWREERAAREADGGGAGAAAGAGAAPALDRDGRLQPLKDGAWEKRKHLVCCYVMTRRARRGETASKKPKL